MYNKTVIDWLEDTKEDVLNYLATNLMFIASFGVVLIMMPWGRKFWMNFINFSIFAKGLFMAICPDSALSWSVQGTTDEVHFQLMRGIGILMVWWAISYWLLSPSNDTTTETSLLWSTTVFIGCELLAFTYTYTHPGKDGAVSLNFAKMDFAYFSGLLCLAVSVFYALRSRDWGGFGELPSHANFHLRLDFAYLLVVGVLMYSMPQWIIRTMFQIKRLDSAHAFFAREYATILIAMSLMSGRAANFLRNQDKECVLLPHLLCYVVVIVNAWWFLLTGSYILTWTQIAVYTIHDLALVLNTVGALDIDPSVFKRVLVPRLQAIPRDVMSLFKVKRA